MMADEPQSLSKRAQAREAAEARRAAKTALSETSFEALAAGWTVQQIAEMRKVSAKTVRREIDRALDGRRLDPPGRYVHLQVARLTKALRLADARIDRGDLAAIGPLTKVVALLDRYHGIDGRPQDPVAILALTEPSPPLALTHASQSEIAHERRAEREVDPERLVDWTEQRAAPVDAGGAEHAHAAMASAEPAAPASELDSDP
jgi:hypothetical protein